MTNSLSAEFELIDMTMVTFDIFIEEYARIKIVNNQLFVMNNGVLEILIDEENLVRDIILEEDIKKNYDDMREIMRFIHPYKSVNRKKAKPYNLRMGRKKN